MAPDIQYKTQSANHNREQGHPEVSCSWLPSWAARPGLAGVAERSKCGPSGGSVVGCQKKHTATLQPESTDWSTIPCQRTADEAKAEGSVSSAKGFRRNPTRVAVSKGQVLIVKRTTRRLSSSSLVTANMAQTRRDSGMWIATGDKPSPAGVKSKSMSIKTALAGVQGMYA